MRHSAICLGVVLFATMLRPTFNVTAAPLAATSPTLGAAASYSVLAGQTVTNTGSTIIPGNLGVSPGSAITGFPPGVVGPPGTIHPGDSHAASAQIASTAAFTALDQPCTVTYAGVKDLVGENLVAGVYCADAFRLSGTLTLSGGGVWIFKSASDLITSGTANVVGGDPCNVWWREVSSVTLGANTSLRGNILASTSISLLGGAILNGRALAQTGSVTLDNNKFNSPPCATTAPPNTSVPAPTASPIPLATDIPAPTATDISAPTATDIAAPTATDIPAPTATDIAAPTATDIPAPTATDIAAPTATSALPSGLPNTGAPTERIRWSVVLAALGVAALIFGVGVRGRRRA
jgi:type VI secretion system secreted protein VgrG